MRRPMWIPVLAALTASAAVALPAAPASAATASVSIDGSGSSAAANAVVGWIGSAEPAGLTVQYAANGSSRGLDDFAAEQTDFAATDLTYADMAEGNPTRAYAYLPLVATAVVFPYQVRVAGKLQRNIRLSGATLTDIFRGAITNWNDPEITADNNGHVVAPDLPITPVVRSDGSATTYRLTDWFSTRYPGRWRAFSDAGATSLFPAVTGRTVAAVGSDGVANRVMARNSNGTIGYVENNYARQAKAPVAAVENTSRHFVSPDPGNVGLSLLRAKISAQGEADLHGLYTNPDARAYPLAYYVYGVIPTGSELRMTTAKRQVEVDFFGYTSCSGQNEVAPLGYAPLPLNLTRAALKTLALLRAFDPAVDVRALALPRCDNATIAHGAHGSVSDNLGPTVPQPPACSAENAGPCKE